MYNFAARVLSNRKIQTIIVLLLVILAAVSVIWGSKNAILFSQDFQWDAAKAFILKMDPYAISMDPQLSENSKELNEFYRLFTDKGLKQKMEANQFPSLLILLTPYTFLTPLVARYAWLLSNILFTVGIIILLRNTFLKDKSRFEFCVLSLLMLAGTPYRNQLGVGQHTLFSFFFFLLAVLLDELKPNGNRISITLCMVISYFKYTLTAPLTLYLLYKKRYREFVASVVCHVIMTIVSAIYIGKDFVYMIFAPLKVASALSAEGGLDLGALFGGNSIALIIGAIIAIALIVMTIKMPSGKGYLLFAVLLLWSLILTYHRTYDFFVLSAAACLCNSKVLEDYSERLVRIINSSYYVLVLLVFFGLRVFNENIQSKLIIGACYYAFTIAVTAIAVGVIYKNRQLEGNSKNE